MSNMIGFFSDTENDFNKKTITKSNWCSILEFYWFNLCWPDTEKINYYHRSVLLSLKWFLSRWSCTGEIYCSLTIRNYFIIAIKLTVKNNNNSQEKQHGSDDLHVIRVVAKVWRAEITPIFRIVANHIAAKVVAAKHFL